ncbi:17.8 kDa class I heat shock protein-like [Nymphaea colorata]|uniref:SHSP domain-containing protein n=1 Tax=Nymphaea colorata TaxID=210225 RepID=A0A5K0ZIW0_9MAGN|nr:17.8 kDa class I heat shock protein-like [Nymphaea colorata]
MEKRREKKNVKEEQIDTQIDWKETSEAHVFKAVKKEEVKVEIEGGCVLQISGEGSKEVEEKKDRWHQVESKEVEEKKDRWHQVERSQGKFLNRFPLPENAKVDQVRAEMEKKRRRKVHDLFGFARKGHV